MNPNRVPVGRILLLSLLVACTELSVEAVDVATVVVQPEDAALQVGASMVLSAQLQDRNGNVLAGRSINWTSSDESVATVDGDGRVTGVGPGTAVVRASVDGRQGEAQVSVRTGTVATVEIQPRQPVVLVGGSVQLTADVRDAGGDPAAEPVTWSTSDTGIVGVAGGLVTGMAAGAAWVRASAGGITDSTLATVVRLQAGTVTVTPGSATLLEADTLRFAALVVGSNGLPVPGAAVTWSTSNAGVAAIDAAGLVTAGDSGQATITASSGSESGTATVRVNLRSIASVTITPPVAGLPVGGTLQLVATARDASGAPLPGRAVSWSSANSQIASVDASGRVTAHSSGSTQISATIAGVVGTAHIAVTAATVASVEVSPSTAQLATGDTVRLTAVALDARGAPLTGRPVTWSSSDPTIATVDNAGLVKAVAGGSATITATVAGVAGAAQIAVTAVPVASVQVAPTTAQLLPGATVTLTATARDASGAVLTGRAVAWSTSNAAVATVDNTGQVLAIADGSATITATIGGVNGTAAITVRVPVASVTVTPGSAQLEIGGTVQLVGTPRDATGAALSGRVVSWSTSDAAVATVATSGLVTAVGTGTATITAHVEGQTATSVITVLPPVSSVQITPAFTLGRVDATLTLTATVFGAGGPIPGYPVVWSSSDTGNATVDAQGRVTLHSVGTVEIRATAGGRSNTATILILP